MATTPAGSEPNRPHQDGSLAPTAPGNAPTTLTTPQKWLVALALAGGIAIAGIGFVGSYHAVTALAYSKGFGSFSRVFTLGVDIGIGVFLAIDLLLTWLRMPYPVLRYGAWLLTGATIVFNASVLWPDPLGAAMHAVIPLLFIVAVEAARHAVGRIAQIVADKHLEGPNASRWLLNPVSTFVLWRRQRLWGIRLWDTVLELERERRIYIGQLRREHGRSWRRKARAEQLLVLRLAKDGMSITEAIALPEKEAEKQRAEEDRITREREQAAAERHRRADEYKREQQRLEDERIQRQEDQRIERERKALELEQARKDDQRAQELADAEHQAALDEIARQKAEAAAEADRIRREQELAHAQAVAAEQERAAQAARRLRENQEAAARAAQAKEAASRRAAEIVQRASANATATTRATSPASASRTATSQPANPVASGPATSPAEPASATSANPASPAATSRPATNANASQNAASAVDIGEVVDVYTLLKEKNGKAPSDRELGEALNVSRSRAQQLRTAAIDAGHTELAKPMRIAS